MDDEASKGLEPNWNFYDEVPEKDEVHKTMNEDYNFEEQMKLDL